jgi:hypothetical protein
MPLARGHRIGWQAHLSRLDVPPFQLAGDLPQRKPLITQLDNDGDERGVELAGQLRQDRGSVSPSLQVDSGRKCVFRHGFTLLAG